MSKSVPHDPVYVGSRELMRLAHYAAKSDDKEIKAASDSIYSLIALNLRHNTIIVPEEMMPYYRKIQEV